MIQEKQYTRKKDKDEFGGSAIYLTQVEIGWIFWYFSGIHVVMEKQSMPWGQYGVKA